MGFAVSSGYLPKPGETSCETCRFRRSLALPRQRRHSASAHPPSAVQPAPAARQAASGSAGGVPRARARRRGTMARATAARSRHAGLTRARDAQGDAEATLQRINTHKARSSKNAYDVFRLRCVALRCAFSCSMPWLRLAR